MIGERSELLTRLLRYHSLVRGMTDKRTRDALHAAIAAIEHRLAELDHVPLDRAPMEGRAPRQRPAVSRARRRA